MIPALTSPTVTTPTANQFVVDGEMLGLVLAGIAAAVIGMALAYMIINLREKKRAEDDMRSALAVVYHEIKDNMITLKAGANIGLMRVNTSGLELLKNRNIFLRLPDDLLKDLLSVYWYFNFINEVVNLEMTLFMVSSVTDVDRDKISEINDNQAKETHRRCLKEIQKTRILSRLEGMLR